MKCPTPDKKWYPTRKIAKTRARGILNRMNLRLRPYSCVCGGYHLSSHKNIQPQSERLGEKLRNL